jgi:DnaK suppressor protein
MAKQSTAITALESKRRKAALESKLRQLRGAFRERDELQIEYMADPNDQIRSSTDREMTIHLLDQQSRLIHDVKSALARIDEGTYGLCEQCESPIPSKRLDAALGSPLRPLPVRSGNRQP